ncbi:iron chelate uptake ABC transporter family permease subunit [Rhodobacterales bacterium HKCCA1058]|nr:iron chelate uptake ABC transporter family permease subunit [Rhodobacterales bacterium HKCCA1058]
MSGVSQKLLFTGLGLMVGLLTLASLLIGPAGFSIADSLAALFGGTGDAVSLVMQEIRLPRALLAIMVGISLGLSGAALQGYLRNPLAEPGLIGVSSSAALGAVVTLQTGLAAQMMFALPFFGLFGAGVAVVLLLLLAGPRGGSLTLILAGIAISALAAALTSLILNLSPNPFATSEIVFWMLGSLADRSFSHITIALPFMVLGWILILSTSRGLDALILGEDAAASLGINLTRLRWVLVLGVAACTGAATSVVGAIGFVGLVVPHILRPFVGARPSRLLPASALGGAALVLAADIAARIILPDRDLKLGVVMAIIGAPVFLHLIYRTRRAEL